MNQRAAFQAYRNGEGGCIGIQGSAGDPVWFWDWSINSLIGTRFAGHPMNPEFQEAGVVADSSHPVSVGLPAEWQMTDEWCSFKTSRRPVPAGRRAGAAESDRLTGYPAHQPKP